VRSVKPDENHNLVKTGYRPLVSQTDAVIAADLALAGLEFIERITTEVHRPLPLHHSPASCRREHGRFDSEPDEIAHLDDPGMPVKINAGWWRMAQEFALLDKQREFLLGVDYSDPDAVDGEYCWVRVRLGERWDLAGSGSAALGSFGAFATERFVPEFTMLSLDQRMILSTTIWGNATVSTVVVRPDRRR
jgi:hypothetical protein